MGWLGGNSKKRTHHRGDQPLQGGQFQVETPRKRVDFFQEFDLPEYIVAKAPYAIRFVIIVNEGGEILSIDDLTNAVQVTWNQLAELAYKPADTPFPSKWYCIRTLRVSGTQVVHHLTLPNPEGKGVEKVATWLNDYLWRCFPDAMDIHYQRESRGMA